MKKKKIIRKNENKKAILKLSRTKNVQKMFKKWKMNENIKRKKMFFSQEDFEHK